MEFNLKGKVAVVTGGGRGIGEAICFAFANEGTHIVVSDIDYASAQAVAERIRSIGPKAIPVEADVARQDHAAKLISTAIGELGGIDCLVNNAGISPKNAEGGPAMTWEIGVDEWDRVMGINLKGSLFCSQEAVKYMISKKAGAIVNIASIAGKAPFEPMATGAHYDASKAAIINLTQRLASEVAEYGIRVNAVAPGRIASPMAKFASQRLNQAMLERTPMGRFGTPEEIAKVVVFLASDGASYVTGETVNVNGGWIMD
ncbi:MAG: SDR family oxidoreductase [Syntrophales bacterium]|jgi:3-oxoacyl-[acyl-carrier protein] reductase|nr:SDR family oxidoreductase [Syntrophales bacterium]MDY0044119.1 SDR family NAD(P)-dependent oxidoreductase [Syntrophales bacterium]